jgi:hypothetical protein
LIGLGVLFLCSRNSYQVEEERGRVRDGESRIRDCKGGSRRRERGGGGGGGGGGGQMEREIKEEEHEKEQKEEDEKGTW